MVSPFHTLRLASNIGASRTRAIVLHSCRSVRNGIGSAESVLAGSNLLIDTHGPNSSSLRENFRLVGIIPDVVQPSRRNHHGQIGALSTADPARIPDHTLDMRKVMRHIRCAILPNLAGDALFPRAQGLFVHGTTIAGLACRPYTRAVVAHGRNLKAINFLTEQIEEADRELGANAKAIGADAARSGPLLQQCRRQERRAHREHHRPPWCTSCRAMTSIPRRPC